MSEGNVPPRQNDSDALDSVARAEQTPAPSLPSPPPYDDWEVVPLTGMPPLGEEAVASGSNHPRPFTHAKQAELQTRIRDLNQCNEVLLSRVNQLEEALERSQHALQQEVERSQRQTEEKVVAAQNHSVAQLLKELEESNAALERQTILAETLTAQLQTFQERSEQLEADCTQLRQLHSEKAQKLRVAEETCADLRSRLQRQQRYTLQFKAALEKCLDTSAFNHTSSAIEEGIYADSPSEPEPAPSVNPLVMPRSTRIQPWSATAAAQADPQLLSLMRSQPLPSEPVPPAAAAQSFPNPTAEAEPEPSTEPAPEAETSLAKVCREAEQQLWHDVERVIDTTTAAASDQAKQAEESDAVAATPADTAAPETQFTEPIPWGAPIQKEIELPTAAVAASNAEADELQSPSEELINPAAQRSPKPEPPESPAFKSQVPKPPSVTQPSTYAASIPALDAMKTAQASPSPIVHPFRSTQPKRKSLSAVELPSFPPLPKVNHSN